MKRSRAGFTLIELMISTGLIGVMLGTGLAIVLSGNSAYRATILRLDADAKARRALERVVSELESARGDLTPDLSGSSGSSVVNFVQLVDVVNGVTVWGNPIRIARVAASEDPDDGIDNDNDGLIDEGLLVLTRDVGLVTERSIVLCTNVREMAAGEQANGADDNGNGLIDEAGFCVQRTTDLLTVRISIEQVGAGDARWTSNVTTAFNLRN